MCVCVKNRFVQTEKESMVPLWIMFAAGFLFISFHGRKIIHVTHRINKDCAPLRPFLELVLKSV